MTERGGPSPRRADRPERVAAGPRGHAARTPQAGATRGASARPRPPPRRAPTSRARPNLPTRSAWAHPASRTQSAPPRPHGQRGRAPPPGHEREPGRDVAPSKHIRLGSWSGARSPPLCVWFCSRPEPALLSGNPLFSYCPILRFLSGQSWSGSSAWSSSDCPRSDSGGRRVLPSLSFPQQHPAQSL